MFQATETVTEPIKKQDGKIVKNFGKKVVKFGRYFENKIAAFSCISAFTNILFVTLTTYNKI